MKRISLILLIVIAVACTKTNKGLNYPDIGNISEFVIKYNPEWLLFSEFLGRVEYVRLETNTESLIASVDKVIASDEAIYILDLVQHSITCFGIDGRYIARFYQQGRGPGEYLEINDIDIINSQLIALLDNQRLVTLDGKLAIEKTESIPFRAAGLLAIDNSRIIFFTDQFSGELKEGSNEFNQLIEYDVKSRRAIPLLRKESAITSYIRCERSLYRSDDLSFSLPNKSTILSLGPGGIEGGLVLILDKYREPNNEDTEASVIMVRDVFRKGNYLSFNWSSLQDGRFNYNSAILDIEAGNSYNRIKDDIDLLGMVPIKGTFRDGFIGYLNPQMVSQLISIKPEVLRRLALDNTILDNPTIVFYHVKQ